MATRMGFSCLAVLGILCFSASSALGDDVIAPDWRGDGGSTYQQWLFGTNATLDVVPDVMVNSYGGASADISVGFMGTGWWDEFPEDSGRTGLWDLGRGEEPGEPFGRITLDIQNRVLEDPLSYKEIWLQVTYYYTDITKAPVVTIEGATQMPGGETRVLQTIPDWGEYRLDQTKWRIEPNPDHETIVLTAAFNGSIIDQVVVDTICIPEPASLALLLGGGLTLALRRRAAARRRAA